MKFKSPLAALALTILLSAPVFAAQASPGQVYAHLFSSQAEEVVAAAEAMPADKYNFVPTGGDLKEYEPSASKSRTLLKRSISSSLDSV